MKEEVDYDPSKTESLRVELKVNDIDTISGIVPWIIEDFEDKIQTTLGIGQLNSLAISRLDCKSIWVSNELLDLLTSFDLPEQGLEKLSLIRFGASKISPETFYEPEPFEDEVMSRLSKMCHNLS